MNKVLVLLLLVLGACSSPTAPDEEPKDIPDVWMVCSSARMGLTDHTINIRNNTFSSYNPATGIRYYFSVVRDKSKLGGFGCTWTQEN